MTFMLSITKAAQDSGMETTDDENGMETTDDENKCTLSNRRWPLNLEIKHLPSDHNLPYHCSNSEEQMI